MIVINVSVQTKDIHINAFRIESPTTGVQIFIGALVNINTARIGVSGEPNLSERLTKISPVFGFSFCKKYEKKLVPCLAGTVMGPIEVMAVRIGLLKMFS